MTYNDLLSKLSPYSRVIVSGPQRSGTTYTAFILSQDLNYTHIDEQNFGTHTSSGFLEAITRENIIVQCPAVSHVLDQIQEKNTIILWIDRNDRDIALSEDRINWHPHWFNVEKDKYRTIYGDEVDQFERNSLMKKHYWGIQKQTLKVDYLDIPYSILKETKGFVSKDQRKNFGVKQIQL